MGRAHPLHTNNPKRTGTEFGLTRWRNPGRKWQKERMKTLSSLIPQGASGKVGLHFARDGAISPQGATRGSKETRSPPPLHQWPV